ncbi:hypothetical protein [Sulfobacillus harzensis]|uniref:Uncharacterized protein n=1 Tax=Sulfobacillus harzensis TaxID=2729629 RepID=A0A7Y0L4G9_9FIRM|nr:hypothetical protein [Sulfobacillus harzensis]NMP22511.1 hypothetical protein [Sulfobacillus harzensis]
MMKRDIKKQAVKFWNSPWAYHSEWTNGRGVSARFYVENDQLIAEIEAPEGVESGRARAEGTELTLEIGDEKLAVPLPSPVSASPDRPIAFEEGKAELQLPRPGLEGQLE